MTTPAEWGPEFLVNTETEVSQFGARVIKLSDGRFAAVWVDNSTFFEDDPDALLSIRLQVFDPSGAKLGPELLIDEALYGVVDNPALGETPEGDLIVIWDELNEDSTEHSIRATKIDTDGNTLVGEFKVNENSGGTYLPEIEVLSDGKFIVTWGTATPNSSAARIFNADGSALTAEFAVPARLDSISELPDGRIIGVYSANDGSAGGIFAQIYNPDGSESGGEIAVNTATHSEQSDPQLAILSDGKFVIIWQGSMVLFTGDQPSGEDQSNSAIRGQIFNSDGTKFGGEFEVNTTSPGQQAYGSVTALPDGGFVAVWMDQGETGSALQYVRGQRFDATGAKVGAEFVVTDDAYALHGTLSVTSLGDGRFVVSWDALFDSLEDNSYLASHARIYDTRGEAVALVGTGDRDLLSGTNFDDTVDGLAGDDELFGGDGADDLSGGDDDDVLSGGEGSDTLDGGSGTDTASYRGANGAVVAKLAAPGDNTGEASGDTYVSIENLTGSRFGDTLHGDAGNNAIEGLGGDDELLGGAGDDTLDGGEGIDTATYRSGATGGVTVDLSIAGSQNTGSAGSDTLISIENLSGTDFQDSLTGSGEDNTIEGFDGADTLDGGGGNNTLSYDRSSAAVAANLLTGVVTGGHGSGDTISNFQNLLGSDFDDTLTGDGGDNVLTGGAGGDALDGGGGTDTASYLTASAGVIADLGLPSLNTGDALGDTYTSIENLEGSLFDDLLIGNAGVNHIAGSLGDDIIEGGSGADILDGGEGFDYLSYFNSSAAVSIDLEAQTASGGDADGDTFTGFEDLLGSQFADTLTGDLGDNVLEGAAGADTLDGGGGLDLVSYSLSPTAVTVDLGTGTATGGDATGDVFIDITGIIGSEFDDVLTSPTFLDLPSFLLGLGGDDTITAAGTVDAGLYGGDGNDTLLDNGKGNTLDGGDGNDLLDGNSGNDTLTGAAGDDTVLGGFGDDLIVAGTGAGDDDYDGGDGIDTITFASTTQGVTVDFLAGSATGSEIDTDTLANLENAIGGSGSDQLTGNNVANLLEGGAGDDTLSGEDGDDTLRGGDGTDTVYGGAGNDFIEAGPGGADDTYDGGADIDTVSFDGTIEGITLDLFSGTASGTEIGNVSLTSIENAIGGRGADHLTGDNSDNSLQGGRGNDTVMGFSGDDVLRGEAGDDSLFGQRNNDLIYGGAGNDTAYGGPDNDTMFGGAGDDLLIGEDGNDFLRGNEGDDILASGNGSDTLYGEEGLDKLYGGSENDTLNGGYDDDLLVGGTGDDVLNGDAGDDMLAGNDGADTADGGAGNDRIWGHDDADVLSGGADDDDLFGGAGADTLNGNDGDDDLVGDADGDLLNGGAGRDNMYGGLGNDTLDGGADTDVMYGQGGDDLFVFTNGSGFDWVIDFAAGAGTEDRLDITDFGFTTFAQVQAAAFDVGTDLRIQLDADDFVTLKNVAEADLHPDDFFGIT